MFIWMTLFACAAETPVANGSTVLHVEGEVTATGEPLTRGTIVPSDAVLLTGEDARVILELPNGRVVRLDGDLELRPTDFILWNMSQTDQSVDDQLARLLDPEELETVGRIAGGYSRMQAGKSVGSDSLRSNKRRPASRPAAKASPARAPTADAPPAPPKSVPAMAEAASPVDEEVELDDMPSPPAQRPTPQRSRKGSSGYGKAAPPRTALRVCIQRWAMDVSWTSPSVTLVVAGKPGEEGRSVRFLDGTSAPQCALRSVGDTPSGSVVIELKPIKP